MKKAVSSLLAILIVLGVFLSFPLPASAESLYIRKIVSVVYDDSGSMLGQKWAYANYAMQAMCGMLNREDRLFITYMSRADTQPGYRPEEIDLSGDDAAIQAQIDTIRDHKEYSNTPFKAVQMAYDQLQALDGEDKDNPNTQYWLVVITDGTFDECAYMTSEAEKKAYLNEKFDGFSKNAMPNGSMPQMTFLSIGSVVAPDANADKGIFTYAADTATEITAAMDRMADKISGRRRLSAGDLSAVNDTTVRVSSDIPLMNMTVFTQGTAAKLDGAAYRNGTQIPVSRRVSLIYPGYADLVGGAYLIGDPAKIIGAGSYDITFDRAVSLDDVVVLLEPALEMRMQIEVNGKAITSEKELENMKVGDTVAASCKIYEMGSDREISPSLLPSDTAFSIKITEDGKTVSEVTDKTLTLSAYTVKDAETKIEATVALAGFRPFTYQITFTPQKYVHIPVYSMTGGLGGGVSEVDEERIGENRDLTLVFTVYEDGVAVTDPEAVRALSPTVSTDPVGNDGHIDYLPDGKIVFTPHTAKVPDGMTGTSFTVQVTCRLANGTGATADYTVRTPQYAVHAVAAEERIKKTALFGNQVGVSFYVTRDGVRLDKAALGEVDLFLDEAHADLSLAVSVSEDGIISARPYSEEEHTLTFLNWWFNYAYYLGLNGSDIAVTVQHERGTATAGIDVRGEDLLYILGAVIAPALVEFIALAFLIAWLFLVLTKPRYTEKATLYVGDLRYDAYNRVHTLTNFRAVRLRKFNKIKRGNGRLKFKKTADVVKAGGVKVRADHVGRIICEMPMPWFRGTLTPTDGNLQRELETPADIAAYVARQHSLTVREFVMTETIESDHDRTLIAGGSSYLVSPGSGGIGEEDGRKVLKSGKIFIYVNF